MFGNTYFCEQLPALVRQNEQQKVTVNRHTLATKSGNRINTKV